MSGQSTLAIGVPALDDHVRALTPAPLREAGPGFHHAHVTLLDPWREHPADSDLAAVARVVAEHEPFEAVLQELTVFPGGTVGLVAEPTAAFMALAVALVAAFPDLAPYEGAFDDPVPHLSLGTRGEDVDAAEQREQLAGLLPLRLQVTHVDLQWWEADGCRLLHRWPLGGGGS